MFPNFIIAGGVVIALIGLFGLIGVWLLPAIGKFRLYGPRMFTGRMEPNRRNRTIMSLYLLFFGCYIASACSGYSSLSYVFFLPFMVCCITVLIIPGRHSR